MPESNQPVVHNPSTLFPLFYSKIIDILSISFYFFSSLNSLLLTFYHKHLRISIALYNIIFIHFISMLIFIKIEGNFVWGFIENFAHFKEGIILIQIFLIENFD